MVGQYIPQWQIYTQTKLAITIIAGIYFFPLSLSSKSNICKLPDYQDKKTGAVIKV
jgi:hypothetical protein